MSLLSRFYYFVSLLSVVSCSVTVYTNLNPFLTGTANPAFQTAICIGAVPCDGNVLNPIPNPSLNGGQFAIQLYSGGMTGMGIPVSGSFLGFSIELSVSNAVLGNNGNTLNPIFLNLMANMQARAGKTLVRVGGNSQESATVVPSGLPNNTAIEKPQVGTDRTFTPVLLISPNLIYAMGNISTLVNVEWFIGLPFNDTSNPRTTLAEIAQSVLGKNLIGMQLGNEPDLYTTNQLRNSSYTVQDYTVEWGQVLQDYQQDSKVPNTDIFVAPSICCGLSGNGWMPEQVWDTGFLTQYGNNLAYIAVEHYPTNNCNDTGPLDPEQQMPQFFLNHSAVIELSQPYANTSQIAAQMNKPFIMFETNTASCGGFSGLSDSFVSALWTIDYALNMASFNFSNALLHVGGQSDYYNPFTPPTTNQTSYRQWSIGPTYYAALVVAEALGPTGDAQVLDLGLNNRNDLTPGYVIYEQGNPTRVVLINSLTDPSGASNYTALISVGGNNTGQPGATPATVTVKYLLAPSATDKWNITWGGQTFGGPFASDGRLTGDLQTYTVTCDQTNNVCPITVPAPAVAVVFLTPESFANSQGSATVTFETTIATAVHNKHGYRQSDGPRKVKRPRRTIFPRIRINESR
ncbi:hypothetical protein SISSUDRAFT_1046831 [Sistotremastrum suecicum HHB10207 ss-3]|uniref:Beta-glucuronidase C-terminal domain-containing protein n=1 Tax=Sistotremastrum suecicum HHB10207 ss-3 TaxID=1314776 RepID=A0A166DI20_9AGAM|nr:hypothetical protein SISSUDRAFT_1046831 [Sistotremastrum suecicum HHB10207 ss-3]